MTAKDEKFEDFLKRMGLKLLPYQKEILKQVIVNEKSIYFCHSPKGRQILLTKLLKGENDA